MVFKMRWFKDISFRTATIQIIIILLLVFISGCNVKEPVQDNNSDDTNDVNACGNGICDNKQERRSCPQDCETARSCGNNICDERENADNCPVDCEKSSNSICGNGLCESGESSTSCLKDCPLDQGNDNLSGSGHIDSNDIDYTSYYGTLKSNGVTFTDKSLCGKISSKGFCKDFSATCSGALSGQSISKTGEIIVEDPNGAIKGTIILMTGGGGNVAYHDDSPTQKETVNYLLNQGYRVVELLWQPELKREGIISYSESVGAANLFCLPDSVFQAYSNLFAVSGPFCGAGNSGGSMQLAYGLTFYGAESIFDMVILTGGPPTADFSQGCQGYPRSPYGFMPNKALGSTFIDDISGYGENAASTNKDYCQQAWKQKIDIYDNPDFVDKIDSQSLVIGETLAENPSGDYDYPDMFLFFVESRNDESNANNIGKLYYDLVDAKDKSFTEVSGLGYDNGGHNVPSTVEGAAKIRELFTTYCK